MPNLFNIEPVREGKNFHLITDEIRAYAAAAPERIALILDGEKLSYKELTVWMDRVGAALQAEPEPWDPQKSAIAICAATSLEYAAVFLGALSVGVVVAPLAPSSTAEQLAAMIADCGARLLFCDASTRALLSGVKTTPQIALDDQTPADSGPASQKLSSWLGEANVKPRPVVIAPEAPFNIIYSSGTTGQPKGIVQSHAMRWGYVERFRAAGYDEQAVALLSTPLYSNTTLVAFFSALACGGTVVLMTKFDARRFLELAQSVRATHAMLVPVQYQRLMAVEDFDSFDLSSFRVKTCTSAPFAVALKKEVLRRWPGGLIEFYGATEGGATCALAAHLFPDKLHTVGKAVEGSEIRLIDEDGVEVAPGEIGEIVGRSALMMTGYHNLADQTRQAVWTSPEGEIFLRSGDVGRFDADGFLTLMDRRKDMIISGGFNIYPSDLEEVLSRHEAVHDCAVVGVPSKEWGETPVAFVVLRSDANSDGEEIRAFVNAQLGKMQRIHEVRVVEELPRSAIGKILKRQLRDAYLTA